MGNFRSDSRDGRNRSDGRSQGRFGGRSEGRDRGFSRGRDRFGGRDSGRSERRSIEMHDVTCDKCGKECQVPFRPSGNKPVLCSDCFRKNDSQSSFGSRNSDRPSQGGGQAGGISSEQFKQLNTKLNKIIQILQELELDSDDEDLDEDDLEDDNDEEEEEEEESEDEEKEDEDSDKEDSDEDLKSSSDN